MLVNRLDRESRADENFGRKMPAKYLENKKTSGKNIQEKNGGGKGDTCRKKEGDRVPLKRNEVRKV